MSERLSSNGHAVEGCTNSYLGVLIYGIGYRRVEDVPSLLMQDAATYDRRFLDSPLLLDRSEINDL